MRARKDLMLPVLAPCYRIEHGSGISTMITPAKQPRASQISVADPDARNASHADRIGARATEIDATASCEWAPVVDFRNNRSTIRKVRDRHHATEGQPAVRDGIGIGRVGVETFT
jgi:hypothetical protein